MKEGSSLIDLGYTHYSEQREKAFPYGNKVGASSLWTVITHRTHYIKSNDWPKLKVQTDQNSAQCSIQFSRWMDTAEAHTI